MFDEILRALKKHRILLIVTIFVCILSFSARAFAEESSAESDSSSSDSSFVTQSDGRSYEGLPDFPEGWIGAKTNSNDNRGSFVYYSHYILLSDGDNYILWCLTNPDGTVFLTGSGSKKTFTASGGFDYLYADDKSFYKSREDFCIVEVYSCIVGESEWNEGNTADFYLTDSMVLLQSSSDVYTDSTCAEVFTLSATSPLVSGMSSTTLVKMMMMEIGGLVPLVIGFLICLMAFLKAYRVLRRELFRA